MDAARKISPVDADGMAAFHAAPCYPSRPLLRYHGGKWQLAPWINSLMPRHRIYVEPFGGGGSVLLQKPRSYAEIYNDLDGEVVNLFQVVRDRGEDLKRAVELTPFARAEFELSVESSEDPVEQARRTLVRSYMGFGGNLTRLTVSGRPERTGFRNYSKKNRRSIPAQDWRHWPVGLPELIARLQGVIIERRDACEVMLKHDGPDTLHFVDPPYVHETRERTNSYRHEMDEDAHRRLAGVLNELEGGVMLAGYGCPLYDDDLYVGWKRITRKAFADGARERTEVLWLRNVESHGLLPGLDG